MAAKVLKVKLWDGEDGKKWKNNVQDIEGEVLCGAFIFLQLLVHVTVLPFSRHVRPSWCHPLMIKPPFRRLLSHTKY